MQWILDKSLVHPIGIRPMVPAPFIYKTTNFLHLTAFFCSVLTLVHSEEFVEDGVTVYPELLEQRNEDGGRVLVIHDGYSLNLSKASVLADTLLLRVATDAGVIEKYVPGSHHERHLHQDAGKQASLLLKPIEDGHYHVFGLLNFTHRIEPLISQGRSSSGATAHRISRVAFKVGAYDVDDALEDDIEETNSDALPRIEERALPSSFTIEIFTISDSKHTSHFGGDSNRHIEYMIVFWHSATELPYVSLRGPDKLVSNETLLNFERWFWRQRPIRIADVVFLVTARDVVQLVPGGLNSGAAGVAYIGQACMTKKGAIGEDNASRFSGVNAAAHELGHLLGCAHDGSGSSSHCPASAGFLMNPTDSGLNVHKFSTCSNTAITTFLMSPPAFCLKDTVRPLPDRVVRLPDNVNKLPGEVLSGDDYCKKYLPKYAAVSYVKWDSDLTKCKFRCKLGERRDGSPIYAIRFAYDGTRCDRTHPEKKCKNGACV
ncbi:venom metalloproteinase antarease-like TtrivMP_A isoform X2 [Rhipicephalus sanguineus]|uniref:venom metalloproteinase antarease-like TtrivMP_A isoform X2 n=1 Tax=Rhipicephalus sanguineus TaxID=34632 RepID=UPI001894D00C|nr:venom metalloproteinase antarease-like TtrivMP_A isoform X2 [Rhipicephalus sanguineus]